MNQMYALAESAKSEAKKQEDDRTRRKLLIAVASSIPGESDDCVVRLSGDQAEEHGADDGQSPEEEARSEDGGETISNYA